jgi:signal transduction histidine kinase
MNEAKRRRIDNYHSKKIEDFHQLSQQVLYLVDTCGPKPDFIQKVTVLLLDFIRCDEIELLLIQDERYYKYTTTRLPDGSTNFEIERCFDRESEQIIGKPLAKTPLESLSFDILSGEFTASMSCFTESGSFWTGNCNNIFSYGIRIDDNSYERELDLRGSHASLVLIPIKASDEKIGLLCLKSRERDYFREEAVHLLEGVTQTLGVVQAYRNAQLALGERVKELSCLYDIARVAEQQDISLNQLLHRIVELLPPAYQYPEITSSKIILDDKIFVTQGFHETTQKQAAEIVVKGEQRGFVEVIYGESRPSIYEGPFLKEERSLLDAVAREVALIIERKEAEEAESKLQEQLRHADRLATIGQLSAGVAHELNEPLANILGFAQLIKKASELSGQQEKDVDKIVTATLHAREIVKKLMLFARQTPPQKVKCDLNQIVEDGIYFLGARCTKAGIELLRELANDLPLIVADPSQINQVLINLAVNSMQAMPDGGSLIISTRTDNNYVSLIVEDTGIGMEENVIKQIFVPFYTTKDIDEGTGLGLAVVHGIVSSHGGTIEVESEQGRGSKFTVRLPVEQTVNEMNEE